MSDPADRSFLGAPGDLIVSLGCLSIVGRRVEHTARGILFDLGISPDNHAMARVLRNIRTTVKGGRPAITQHSTTFTVDLIPWTLQAGELLRARNAVMHAGPSRQQDSHGPWSILGRRIQGGEVINTDAQIVRHLADDLASCDSQGRALQRTLTNRMSHPVV